MTFLYEYFHFFPLNKFWDELPASTKKIDKEYPMFTISTSIRIAKYCKYLNNRITMNNTIHTYCIKLFPYYCIITVTTYVYSSREYS